MKVLGGINCSPDETLGEESGETFVCATFQLQFHWARRKKGTVKQFIIEVRKPQIEFFMKTYIKKPFLLPALIAALGLIMVGRVTAQTFTTLHSFTALDQTYSTNSDGVAPTAGVVLSGNTLYGTALVGGGFNLGTVFAVNINDMSFSNLHSLNGNTDGAQPFASPVVAGNILYGTAKQGGTNSNGTIFAVHTDGTGFTNLYTFSASVFNVNTFTTTNTDGAYPWGGLILSGDTLYGTAQQGGLLGQGTVFAVNANGTSFTKLHSFAAVSGSSATNSEGANPVGVLLLSGNILYGTTYHGGRSGKGTVFAVNINDMSFTNLHSFAGFPNDGANPAAGLVLSGSTLYGTTSFGGSSNNGVVFALNTDDLGFTNLHSFTSIFQGTNSDGNIPNSRLVLSGHTLYGTASGGGISGDGAVFAVDTNGTGFTTLYNFTATDPDTGTNSDGSDPYAGLILSGNTLYGTTQQGGNSGNGTVFSLSLGSISPPQLTINLSGNNVILAWPTNAAGFTLEFATNLVSPVWNTNLPAPFVVNTNNAVTNLISGTRKFYRLSQ
jgi:uncharacterized repeat protein (TIGR03803 family)